MLTEIQKINHNKKNKIRYDKIRADSILREKYDVHIKQHRANPKNKEIIHCTQKRYYSSTKGKETKKRLAAKRHRELGYNPLNQSFKGCNGHHIDINNVINIPTTLHKLIPHRQSNNESMKQINILAWSFMESSSY